MEKIVTAMLLMLVKAWTTVDTIGSDFKPNVDKKNEYSASNATVRPQWCYTTTAEARHQRRDRDTPCIMYSHRKL